MIIRLQYGPFIFDLGVRIAHVFDKTIEDDEGEARIWGYSYQTLEGHVEQGEIMFEVCKYLETGDVRFRIRAYSRVADVGPLLPRLGFMLAGRPLQKRFLFKGMSRMYEIVKRNLQAETSERTKASF